MSHQAENQGQRARQFAYRVKCAEVVSALADSGIRPVVLKGLAFERLLYPGAERRPAGDLDLMIPPSDRKRAGDVLRALGYEATFVPEDDAIGKAVHAETWHRESDSSWVDLHLTLPEAACSPESSWRALAAHLVPFELRGVPALALDRPASGLLAAVHAAHHGPIAGPETDEDLRRAARLLELAEWHRAAGLARRLDALRPFGEGLATLEEGRALARRLGVGTDLSARRQLLWADAPWGALVLEDLVRSSPLRCALVTARLLAPSSRALRSASPLARKGPGGLVLAYAVRPLALAAKLPAAVRACHTVWRKCRRGSTLCD